MPAPIPKTPDTKTPTRPLSPVLLAAAAFACLLPLSAPLPARADAPKNSIVAIRTLPDGRRPATYTITVTSTAEFPMGASVVTLNIGGQEFINSSYAPGGTLNTLVFSLTRSQFLSLKSGAPVVVYYGADNAALPAAQWSFGTLNLSLLDQAAPTAPVVTAPVVTAPVVTAPVVTAPVVTAPVVTAPVVTAPVKVLAANSLKASQTAIAPSAHAASPHSAATPAASPQKGKK